MAAFKSQLRELTEAQKQEAFEKACKEADFTEGRLVRITEEYYQTALEFIRTNFLVQEPIEKALGVPWNDEVKDFWLSMYKCNVSIMLLADDGDVIAIRTSRFLTYDEVPDDDAIQTPTLRLLEVFCHRGEAKADFFGHFGAKECIHFFGLGTNDKYRHHHLATRMLNASVAFAKHLGIDPIYIKGEGSNIYSKLVYEHSGFELLHEEMFDDFVVDGVKPIQNTGENKSLRFYGLKISSKQ
ncbi:uncharacterized protein LOC132752317 [Ruditapes philippinarum]|uniref:uncharacterized protein LOC132752317 n=1 Tax=Ruditapes philippinarum TaxID=129788 RepID=UPI00295BCCC2|nr:uncharacterized protein LOC132752317 [Ruditapes philippinarum]